MWLKIHTVAEDHMQLTHLSLPVQFHNHINVVLRVKSRYSARTTLLGLGLYISYLRDLSNDENANSWSRRLTRPY